MIYISRKEHFNAAHKLYNPNFSEEENFEIFGPCSNKNWHGHNYEIIVTVKGERDNKTGMVIDLSLLKKIIEKEVEEELDHKNLNLDIPYFKKTIPTTENLAIYIWKKLNKAIELNCKITVILYETPRNFVEYSE